MKSRDQKGRVVQQLVIAATLVGSAFTFWVLEWAEVSTVVLLVGLSTVAILRLTVYR